MPKSSQMEAVVSFLDKVIAENGPRNDTNRGGKPYCGNCGDRWPCRDSDCIVAEAARLKARLLKETR